MRPTVRACLRVCARARVFVCGFVCLCAVLSVIIRSSDTLHIK